MQCEEENFLVLKGIQYVAVSIYIHIYMYNLVALLVKLVSQGSGHYTNIAYLFWDVKISRHGKDKVHDFRHVHHKAWESCWRPPIGLGDFGLTRTGHWSDVLLFELTPPCFYIHRSKLTPQLFCVCLLKGRIFHLLVS